MFIPLRLAAALIVRADFGDTDLGGQFADGPLVLIPRILSFGGGGCGEENRTAKQQEQQGFGDQGEARIHEKSPFLVFLFLWGRK